MKKISRRYSNLRKRTALKDTERSKESTTALQKPYKDIQNTHKYIQNKIIKGLKN